MVKWFQLKPAARATLGAALNIIIRVTRNDGIDLLVASHSVKSLLTSKLGERPGEAEQLIRVERLR